jgi:hypothetical protein
LLPDPPIWRTYVGCLVVVGVVVVGIIAAIVVAIGLAISHADSEIAKANHNSDAIFRAFTGQPPSSSVRETPAGGGRAHAFGPLPGQPTLGDEVTQARSAFAATGYTATSDPASSEAVCIANYARADRLEAAPHSVSVFCSWNGQRSPRSSATIEIEVDVPSNDVRSASEASYPIIGVALYTPVRQARVDVSATP